MHANVLQIFPRCFFIFTIKNFGCGFKILCLRCCHLLTLLLALCTYDINRESVGKRDQQL